jgi:molybdenum cofactor guanylyltransferase
VTDSFTGAVLVGGGSTRMGRTKALLPGHSGAPLAVEALRALAEAGASTLLLSCAGDVPSLPSAPTHTVVHDVRTDLGPLAGLEALLSACKTDWLLLVACDMPSLEVESLRTVIGRALAGAQQAVVPTTEGRLQPLHAAYHRRCLPIVRAALDAGRLRATELARELQAELLPMNEKSFRNVNTPDELRDAGL